MTSPDERAREIMAKRRWLFIDDGEELTGEIAAHLRAYGAEEYLRGRNFNDDKAEDKIRAYGEEEFKRGRELIKTKNNVAMAYEEGFRRGVVEGKAEGLKIGIDGDTGQSVIKMIEEAKKGLAEGCQHCDLQFDRGFAAAREKAAEIAENFRNPSAEECVGVCNCDFMIACSIRKMEA